MPWIRPTLALLCLAGGLAAQPRVELGAPFGDHMVLQRDCRVAIYGRAPRRAPVTVKFAGQERTTAAAADGAWSVTLEPMPASAEPRTMTVECFGTVELSDVLVGDVWFCAGQSNMRFAVKSSEGGEEAITAADAPTIRLLDFRGRLHPTRKKFPLPFLRSIKTSNYYATKGWQRCSPETVGSFSAVAYWFGAKLSRELKVPIGLVHNAVGGVPMEAYIPREVMAADAKLKSLLGRWWQNPDYPAFCRTRGAFNLSEWLEKKEAAAPHHPFAPGFLFDAGVRPFVGSAIKGVLWYQGESNATVDGGPGAPVDPETNRRKLSTLIRSWRAAWKRPELPFYMAQLPGLNRQWAPFREVQWQVAGESPHTGCAVTLDLGHPTNVHPKNKRPVGERLALLALRDTYGRKIVAEGPVFDSLHTDGRRVVLRFANAKGLQSADGEPPRCFELAAAGEAFQPARATIEGERIVLSSEAVDAPVAVRYAWASDPPVNLVNGAGLPAAPFRMELFDVPPNRPDEPFATTFSLRKAVDYLDRASEGWARTHRCFTCHTNGLHLVTQSLASPAGLSFIRNRIYAKDYLERYVVGKAKPTGRKGAIEGIVATTSFFALSDMATNGGLGEVTRRSLDHVLDSQDDGGAWSGWLKCGWPPYEIDDHFGATLVAVALGAVPDSYRRSKQAKVDLLLGWLRAHPPANLHHKGMMLWASAKLPSVAPPDDQKFWRNELLASQRNDGGWRLVDLGAGKWKRRKDDAKLLSSDAYATGFVVFVLRQSGVPADREQITRGLAWLRGNQRETGRWFVRSPKRDGKHFISHAATNFAVMAFAACGVQVR